MTAGEQVSVVWTRPDGREAVRVNFPMPDEHAASALIAWLLGRERCLWCGRQFELSREQFTARIRGSSRPVACEPCGVKHTADAKRRRSWPEAERTREAMREDAQDRDTEDVR